MLWARNKPFVTGAGSVGDRRKRKNLRARAWRVARWPLGLVVGLEVLYLALANGFLAFGGLPMALSGTASVTADVASGWTILPGVIHARGLRVTIQDHNVQSVIELDRVDVVLSLHELASRTFHATRVRGEGLVFRVRNRVAPESKNAPSVRALPPIPGFEDPPVYEAWVPEPPIPDAEYDLWTVHIEDVDVGIQELWVQQIRYLGRARAVGAFELVPARRLWVQPASLVIEPGRIVVDGQDTFRAFSGAIECTVHPFDVRVPDGLTVLRHISTKVRLRGDVAGGELVELFLLPGTVAEIEPKEASLVVDATLDRGVITPGSQVALRGAGLEVRVGELSVDVEEPWSVVGTGEGNRLTATVKRASLTRQRGPGAPVTFRQVTASVTSTTLDAAVPWAMRGADLSLGELAAPDLRVLNGVGVPLGGLVFRGGGGTLRGQASYSRGIVSGKGALQLGQAIASVDGTEIRGTALLDATVHAFDAEQRTGSFDLGFHGSAMTAADASGDRSCPRWSVAKTEASGHLVLPSDGLASGNLDASIDGAMLNWGDVRFSGNGDVRATLAPDAKEGPAASRLVATLRAFQLRVRAGSGPPKRWNADIPRVVVEASLVAEEGLYAGPVEMTVERAHVALGNVSMRGDVRARLRLEPLDLARRSAAVAGLVDVTKASLRGGSQRVEGWWAKVGITRMQVAAEQDLELEGRVSARFRDGLPGLLALAEGDQIPAFLPDLLPLHGLVGTLDVRRHCRVMDVRFSRIEGGPLVASGRIQTSPAETRGAVLVRLSGLELVSAGISLGERGDGVSLLVGQDWLQGQMKGLRSAAAGEMHSCSSPPSGTCN